MGCRRADIGAHHPEKTTAKHHRSADDINRQSHSEPNSLTIDTNLPSTLNLAWDAWLSSEYWFGRFSIWLPPGASQANQFRLRMHLLQWHWKVTGIDLPEKLRDQIAGELAKKNP